MTALRGSRIGLASVLVLLLIAGLVTVLPELKSADRVTVVGYFENSNGLFAGDEVQILGVPVGEIAKIEPQPDRVKVIFWYDARYKVPADANAAVLSPSLVTARAVQLTPAYSGGPVMGDNAVIPEDRTAVPVEWDDFRTQLDSLTEMLQPSEPGGVAPLGAFINTAADNLRGEGVNIRDAIIKFSRVISALSDHSTDIFGTVKNLSILVAALRASSDLMQQLNGNLAAVTALLTADPGAVGIAMQDLNGAVGEVQSFVAENREALGVTSDKLASVSQAVTDSLDDVKQTLHIAPTALNNYNNIWQPAQGALSGALVINNFANTISFLCGAVQAASRMNGEQSAKLCAQYLAPIIKNRQYNFPPLGENLFIGAQARPNEVTYSEDRLRPGYIPPAPDTPPPADTSRPADSAPLLPAEAVATNPADGLPGLMIPSGGGS
ncbi:MCE family protein [Mycolicibacterium hippocampi]|uniref:MCE-family protein MceD n=1 Tax=Mycolicibacterium hippocampi TaxID=659824 RepID=A0A850PTL5_9MYCO|nr:MCE-family protein MceD [Mycolicibacterium hippocampi]